MSNPYWQFVQTLASFIDDERNDRQAADRAKAVSVAREETKAARQAAHEDAVNELERLRACGLITEAEYTTHRARLLGKPSQKRLT